MSDDGCVFCKIVRGEMEAKVVRDEDGVLAFHDIDGRAPVHVLVIPKEHVSSLAEIGRLPDGVAKRLFEVAQEVAEEEGVAESGYAFRINNGPDAGQEVFHLHAHVMGGERVRMP
ncbi:HIT domain-containing protein [Rubrobacter marinus]|uniref:HIT domain-containing protein n=1 Tax=Rubrobacter marinus TaxID=2653852 RepID=A0A6G8PXE7_9ACTN|nr:HIT domain-containing protein [Rubrobacter marinus]QIN78807.1 HIT domain-containing protein [Rubrobacter marinus]